MNKNKRVGKQELSEWTSKALQAALKSKNIKVGFRKTRIWPLDHETTREAMMLSAGFENKDGGGLENSDANTIFIILRGWESFKIK